MYTLLTILVHAAIGSAAALAIAPYSIDVAATARSMWTLSMGSALVTAIGFSATATYLARRIKPLSGAQVGLLCGVVCGGILALTVAGIDFSLVVYLALLVPTLVAIVLAALLDRTRSGWQS